MCVCVCLLNDVMKYTGVHLLLRQSLQESPKVLVLLLREDDVLQPEGVIIMHRAMANGSLFCTNDDRGVIRTVFILARHYFFPSTGLPVWVR